MADKILVITLFKKLALARNIHLSSLLIFTKALHHYSYHHGNIFKVVSLAEIAVF